MCPHPIKSMIRGFVSCLLCYTNTLKGCGYWACANIWCNPNVIPYMMDKVVVHIACYTPTSMYAKQLNKQFGLGCSILYSWSSGMPHMLFPTSFFLKTKFSAIGKLKHEAYIIERSNYEHWAYHQSNNWFWSNW